MAAPPPFEGTRRRCARPAAEGCARSDSLSPCVKDPAGSVIELKGSPHATRGAAGRFLLMATTPPPEQPPQPTLPPQPAAPPPEVSPPQPDIDVPDPGPASPPPNMG